MEDFVAEMLGAHVMKIMRLLTPVEVSKMSNASEEDSRVSLTKLMQDMDANITAKDQESAPENVIPFKKKDEVLLEEIQSSKKVQENQQEMKMAVGDDVQPESSGLPHIVDPYAGSMGQSAQKATQQSQSVQKRSLSIVPDVETKTRQEGKLAAIGVHSQRMKKEIQKKQQEEEDSKKQSSSVFLLEQKEKSAQSQFKLKGKEIIDLYTRVNKQDIIKSDEEEAQLATREKGVLLNKLQE